MNKALIILLFAVSLISNISFAQDGYNERIGLLKSKIEDMDFKRLNLREKNTNEKFLSNISFFKSSAVTRNQNYWRAGSSKMEYKMNYASGPRQDFDFEPGLGLSTVDSSTFYMLRLNPSYSYDMRYTSTGYGMMFYSELNLPLRYSSDKFAFRKADYNSAAQVLSSLNLSLGFAEKKVNVQAGFQQISNANLGFGSIMYQYTNSPSYEARKNGINLNAVFPSYAITSNILISDITSGGVMGAAFNFFPLELLRDDYSGEIKIPILKNFVAGFNYAGDFNENAGVTKINYSIDTTLGPDNIRYFVTGKEDKGAINIVNMFAGAKLFGDENHVLIYADYSKIFNFGDNFAAGLNAIVESEDVSFTANIQRRFQGGKYLPTYFDSFYETDRYNLVTSENNSTVPYFSSKAAQLDTVKELRGSTYGEANLILGKVFSLTAAYQKLDINTYGGEAFFVASVSNESYSQPRYTPGYFELNAGYYRKGIKESGDLFTLNENAIFFGQMSYVLSRLFTASLTYRQTFAAIKDINGTVIGYEPQKSFQPELRLNLGL